MRKYILVLLVSIFGLFIFNLNSVYALRPAGCTATSNFSITTGESCTGESSSSTYLPNCSLVSGYKLITNQSSCTVATKSSAVFNFKAKSPENNNLSWYVNWGDTQGMPKVCPSSFSNNTLSVSHAWSTAGTYNIKLGVSDCKGGDTTASFNVVVKDPVTLPNTNVPVSTPIITAPPITSSSLPAGCTATSNFSITTGYVCNTNSSVNSNLTGNMPEVSTAAKDTTGLKGEFVSFDTILLSWNPIHTYGYKGGYNIYKNGNLFARTRTDLANEKNYNPTEISDSTVRCPSTQRYQVELFQYGQYWNIIPSGMLSDVAVVVGTSCPNPTISVVSPNGGEAYKTGSTVNINWDTTWGGVRGGMGGAMAIYKYKPGNNYYGVSPVFGIFPGYGYFTPGQTEPQNDSIIDSLINNRTLKDAANKKWSATVPWIIPSSFPPGDYVVWVSGTNAIQDTSDAAFSIIN